MLLSPIGSTPAQLTRRRFRVRGQVQGVGFRPFVYRLAQRHELTGFIRNDPAGVVVEAQGGSDRVQAFATDLTAQAPALASISELEVESLPLCDEHEFVIQASTAGVGEADVTVDTALCGDCLHEMLDRQDRRAGYGLINCTNCGPRFSIIRRVPYDRPNTTMAGFEMCPACAAEYGEPANRRFHAQPIACPKCGPRLQLVDPHGHAIPGDPICGAAARLAAGKIVAIKGLGGFHLAVRADSEEAVGRLRRLKQRDHKPFALMCGSIEAVRKLVTLSAAAEAALLSPMAPIVLAARREDASLAPSVAPGCHRLGVMLPYTPIHHLLFAAMDESARGAPYVMTSGNLSDEPLAIDNDEAIERLGSLCDALLLHDRPIERCVDDSVMIDTGGEPLPIRRSRGYAPASIRLPGPGSSMGLCVGGELKNTLAVVRGQHATLSQHLGDLTHPLAFEHFKRASDDLRHLFAVTPQWIAHDLHPLYQSTVYAKELATQLNVPLVGVQHHHAHAAALLAEHAESGPILAVVCDGTGYATDGTIWGGELLVVNLLTFERVGHVHPMMLPGGDAASKDARRCAVGLLHRTFGDEWADLPIARRLIPDEQEREVFAQMLRRSLNCPVSSSMGRVFDGVAALLGVCSHNEFEAQAAMQLESAAADCDPPAGMGRRFRLLQRDGIEIDLGPLVRDLVNGVMAGSPVPQLAALFHEQVALAWKAAVVAASERTGIKTVGLTGGVFCNERLTRSLTRRLEQKGFRVLRHRWVPPNDGGLALGQAAIAAAKWAEGSLTKAGA